LAHPRLTVTIMSGVDDGTTFELRPESDGDNKNGSWTISIGRHDDNDLCLRNDTYISRKHACLHWRHNRWWLEDCRSTNGTFLEDDEDFFADKRVINKEVPLDHKQLFRVGRTWLRIQATPS